MKTTISKILGVGLSAIMVASVLLVGAPAKAPVSAATLDYSAENPIFLPAGAAATPFVDYAVAGDGKTIYAVAGTGTVYKSTNGGSSFVPQAGVTAGILPAPLWNQVAVAPDDPNTVVISSTLFGVVVSTNGGATAGVDSWKNTTAPAALAAINDLAISPAVSGVRQVVVAGAVAPAAPGLFALNLGDTVAAWTDMTAGGFTTGLNTPVHLALATTAVTAVAFSPNFVMDRTMVAVTSDAAAGNFLNLARFQTNNTGSWNAPTFPDLTFASTATGIINANAAAPVKVSLALAPTFSGMDSASRLLFVSIDTGAALTSGIWRMVDATSTVMLATTLIRSVAYNGTSLVAGHSDSNLVRRTTNNPVSSPAVWATNTQFQRPSGGPTAMAGAVNTKVAWVGEDVLASTETLESAVSRSTDGGATFNDVSNYATTRTTITDIAISNDGTKIYMVSNDGTDVSVWKKTGTSWARIMTILIPAGGLAWTVRIAPDNADAVYIVQLGVLGAAFYYSADGGDKVWETRIPAGGEAIGDFAVESAQVVYYATGTTVRSSTNSGFLWSSPATVALTGVGAGVSQLRSLGKDQLLITNVTGQIAWSTNAGATFTRTSASVAGAAAGLVADASGLATGDFIYAAGPTGATGIVRYTIGSTGADAVWSAISVPAPAATAFTGIDLVGGVLYVHESPQGAGGGVLNRSINPTVSVTTVAFNRHFSALAPVFGLAAGRTSNLIVTQSGGNNVIWGINGAAGLASFTDTLSKGPTLTTPVDKALIGVNPASGAVYGITLGWDRPSLATAYAYDIALDPAFNQSLGLTAVAPVDPAITPVAAVVPAVIAGALNPGTTYYWRVRSTLPVNSPWSATRQFTIGNVEKQFAVSGPEIGATDVSVKPIISWNPYPGALWYQLIISEDPSFAIPDFSHNVNGTFFGVSEGLKNGTTYYWRVRGVTGEPFTQAGKVITPAGPWVEGAFTTIVDPETTKEEPAVIVVEKPAPPAPPAQVITVEKEVPAAIPSWMLMTVIIIGAVLIIALIVLIVRTRRVA